ncbi:MAG TPA: RNA polymerase sigma factor [Bacteroidales bacterium]|nr:RNA polymerase sigma factor [Bacteroidales bacterium]HSA44781.1 RNA polymerase sigma factor [Bacteroidales bacterium]
MTVREFNDCVDQHSDGVYRFILKTVKDTDKAKDIVQESFTRMWEKVNDISYEKAKSYLFTAAYHNMIDTFRRESRLTAFEEAPFREMTTENQYNDLKEILNEAVEKLPPIQKSVLLLRDYEGYSYEEIGRITSLNESQVKVYIFRARNFLKQYIGSLDKVI